MRVMPTMNVNFAYSSSEKSNNISNPGINLQKSSNQNKEQIAFTGLGALGRFLSPKVYSEAQAIESLRGKDYGLFIRTAEGFVNYSIKKFFHTKPNTTEIIYKNSQESTVITAGTSKKFNFRIGITPSFVIDALETKTLKKATAVVDDGMHVLYLPEDSATRDKALAKLSTEDTKGIEREHEYHVIPTYLPESNFNLAAYLIKKVNTAGLRLEKKPFSNT